MNNALNFFPTTTGAQNADNKLQQLLYQHSTTRASPTQIQATLAASLYDDAVEYLTTLDMNRAASYTFGAHNTHTDLLSGGRGTRGESVAEEMWQLLVDLTLLLPTRHSPLALTKTVSLTKYVLLYGSEACVMDAGLLCRIEAAVRPLRELNTAIAEQQAAEQILNDEGGRAGVDGVEALTSQLAQFGSKATAAMLKLKGGSVDRGHPVREAAIKLYAIVANPHQLRQLRIELASQQQSSLVPVGSTKQVGYITDEARLRLLKQKVAREEQLQEQEKREKQERLQATRSNLAGRSAVDSFGGGYGGQGGGPKVVGAANSLEDMIRAARHELDRHKARRHEKAAALTRGYTDDPTGRQRRLEALEGEAGGLDLAFEEKEKALRDALEYLEEMQKLEQEKVGDLLEGEVLGDAAGGGGGGVGAAAIGSGGGDDGGAMPDLLGFDDAPAPLATDVFGGALAPVAVPPAPPADLLGLDGVAPSRTAPATHGIPGYMGGNEKAENDVPAAMAAAGGGLQHLRPSLVTGTASGPFCHSPAGTDFMGAGSDSSAVMGMAAGAEEPSEEAQAETTRKTQMAEGLFAGVLLSDKAPKKEAASQRKPIMAMGNNSEKMSALDNLLPIGETAMENNNAKVSALDSVITSPIPAPTMAPPAPPLSEPFGTGPMGGSTGMPLAPSMVPPEPSLSDPFGAGPMGGSIGTPLAPTMAPPPSMAPPPPPPMEPPQPPPPLPTVATPSPAVPVSTAASQNSGMLGGNPSVEQMQEMIKQQQAQMNQMMQMMQQMKGGAV